MASDFVPQQPNGYIRSEILLNRTPYVQGRPLQSARHGRGVSLAHAAVVLSELHVQGAVQPVPAPRGHLPVTADQFRQGRGIHGQTRNVIAHGALPAAGAVVFRMPPDQAV